MNEYQQLVFKRELEIADALHEVFQKDQKLNSNIIAISDLALKFVVEVLTKVDGDAAAQHYQNVVEGERFLTIFKGKNAYGELFEVLRKTDNKALTLLQRGELIRLFAGLCEAEDGLEKNGVPVPEKNKWRAKHILKVNGEKAANLGDFCSLRAAYRSTEWGELAFSKTYRKRKPRKGGVDAIGFPTEIVKFLGSKGITGVTGITRNELQKGSVIKLIDDTHGLPYGADISGTTADTIWAIEALASLLHKNKMLDAKKWDENLLLFPIASIVRGFHHTILETAVALNINSFGNYTPGLYTTLQTEDMKKTQSGKIILGKLQVFEKEFMAQKGIEEKDVPNYVKSYQMNPLNYAMCAKESQK